MIDLAKQAVALARKHGAQEASASAALTRDVELVWRDGKIETISESTSRGVSLELYVDGRFASVGTKDTRPAALADFVARSVGLTRALAKDPYRALPDPWLYRGQPTADLQLYDAKIEAVTPEERRVAAEAMEQAARGAPGREHILSVTTRVGESRQDWAQATSNGFEGTERRSSFTRTAEVSVKDKDGRRPEDFESVRARFLADLPAPDAIGRLAAERAQLRLGARKVASARLPMVVDHRVAGRLLSYVLSPLEGRELQQRRSFLEGKVGQPLFAKTLSIVDDPLLLRGLGSRRFDSEGIAARPMPLFEEGTLRNYYVDCYYGRKLRLGPTTRRPSNLSFTLGTKDQAALLAGVSDGIFVTGFLGGNSNATTGDFSLGVQGHKIVGGKPADPISEMNIAGNHLELWKRLTAVGNDPYPYSTLRAPTLVFDGVQFAGV